VIRLVYIAGPFRAPTPWQVEQNIRDAEAISVAVARMPGLFPVCPHTMGRFLSGAAPDKVWLEGDLEMLRRCDAVLLVPRWYRSSGTRAELVEAHRLGIPVFEASCPLEVLAPVDCGRVWPGSESPDIRSTMSDWAEEPRKAVAS
jgi:nucleoside 2-deoxyribosyltransferase